METQEPVEYSGSSPSPPRGILPNREAATKTTKTTNRVEDRTNSQPKLLIVPPRAHLETLPSPCGEMKPHTTKAMVAVAATPKTTLSIPSPTSWGWRETDLLRRSSRWRWRRFTVAGEVWKAGVAVAAPWRTSPVRPSCGPESRSSCCVNVGGLKSSSLIKLPHRQYSHRLLVDITRVSR